ncbi:MAG TPA: HlyC/CorC family transporter [Patescibacteria group bacterium]|nr:HlyC/CorC family transporter [Patescibacteria group bacterium]
MSTLVIPLCAIGALILMSAFFAGSETALTGVSRSRMHALEKEGNKRARLVIKLRERKEHMIGALLLGNTLINILSSAIATDLFTEHFGQIGIFYATAAMTVTLLIFAEVMPKTYALHNADEMAMTIAPLVRLIIGLFAPFIRIVGYIVRAVLRLFGVDIGRVNVDSHIEVLRGAIELHHGPEEEKQEQRAMLRSILDLSNVTVEEVMVHRKNIETIDGGNPVGQVIDDALKSPYTRIPVWKDSPDNIVGIIHTKSMLKEIQAQRGDIDRIRTEALVTEPWFVPESTTLFDQLQEFRKRREHFALVVDEYGALMGLVTLEDILEEIVGEIDDETDEIVAGVRKQPNGSYLIDGTLTIRDLNREFEWGLPDDKGYSTIAGLVLHESQTIPNAGQVFHFYNFTFEVVRRQRNQITLVRVTTPKKPAKEEDKAKVA